ncbi:MAG TPA: tetratricopeptide repeat protein [Candidatus Acidoferrales bacterium]|nr:tetratricopeptide repeat protein [Candidatus Acidoferrales bacterium]
MRLITMHYGVAGVLLLAATPAFADTAAGLTAFKNKDYPRAYKEWKAAADAGQAEAQFDLGLLYAQGLGVQRDLTVAAQWYLKAAEQGNAEAQFALGQMYSRGWGIPRDMADAIRWIQMANAPDAEGPPTDWLAVEGYGMPQDPKLAAYWYWQAADNGHPEAQFNLARLYSSGKGVKRDEEQAARWVSASAAQGYAPAQASLGERFATGNGVTKDDKHAYFWLTLAFLHGEKSGEKTRSAEAAKLAPAEVAQQDRAAQNWKPRMASAKVKQ